MTIERNNELYPSADAFPVEIDNTKKPSLNRVGFYASAVVVTNDSDIPSCAAATSAQASPFLLDLRTHSASETEIDILPAAVASPLFQGIFEDPIAKKARRRHRRRKRMAVSAVGGVFVGEFDFCRTLRRLQEITSMRSVGFSDLQYQRCIWLMLIFDG